MSELSIRLHWRRAEAELKPGAYTNRHTVRFSPEHALVVDAAPDWGGDPGSTNPEQALASALSSCHMMTFLALAAKARWPVASYDDHAVAHLGKSPAGRMAVTRVDLHPVTTFDAGFSLEAGKLESMHERAHRYCFVAGSLADWVAVDIVLTTPTEDTRGTERHPAP